MKVIVLSILLMAGLKLQAQVDSTKIFLHAKGTLSYPIADTLIIEMSEYEINPGLEFLAKGSVDVVALYEGRVVSVTRIENMYVAIIKFSGYFITYSELKEVTVKRGDYVKQELILGKVMQNEFSEYRLSIILSNANGNLNPFRG